MSVTQTSTYLHPKRHYQVLDGLRGVAAITVVIFHTFEAYADENRFNQILNHGYLAVDFFFLYSPGSSSLMRTTIGGEK